MPEMTALEKLVLSIVEKAVKIRASELFITTSAATALAPFTEREVVAAIWRLKDRGLISVGADGTLTIVPVRPRAREVAIA